MFPPLRQFRQRSRPPRSPASPAAQPADPAAAPPANPRRALVEAEQRLRQYGLDPRLEQRGLVISLPQAILFPSGEDRVAPSAFPILAQIAQVVSGIPNKVALVGHADSLPIHNARFQNNWQLSAARSLSLLALLTGRYGIPKLAYRYKVTALTNPRALTIPKRAARKIAASKF